MFRVLTCQSLALKDAHVCVGTRLAPSAAIPAIVRFAVVSGAAISSLAAEFEAVVVRRNHAVWTSPVTRPANAFEPLIEAFLSLRATDPAAVFGQERSPGHGCRVIRWHAIERGTHPTIRADCSLFCSGFTPSSTRPRSAAFGERARVRSAAI
jgi:hypothetical protein